MKKLVFLIIALAGIVSATCDSEYETCITNCCASCGSTLTTDANGDLVCNVGTQSNPNYECIDACMPCSDDYQECIENEDGISYSTSANCCGSSFILLALGIGILYIRK